MSQNEAKRLAAEKAIEYVEDGMIVGVGTGSTVAFFIDALGRIKHRIAGAVSSSEQSTERLRAQVNVENLLDTDYFASAHNNNNITPGAPRGVRFAVTVR